MVGYWLAMFFYYAGDVPAVIKEIRSVLRLDAITVTKKTIGKNLEYLKENDFY